MVYEIEWLRREMSHIVFHSEPLIVTEFSASLWAEIVEIHLHFMLLCCAAKITTTFTASFLIFILQHIT